MADPEPERHSEPERRPEPAGSWSEGAASPEGAWTTPARPPWPPPEEGASPEEGAWPNGAGHQPKKAALSGTPAGDDAGAGAAAGGPSGAAGGPRLLARTDANYTIFPIRYPAAYKMYKQHLASFWTAEEVDLSEDALHYQERLTPNERGYVDMILAFFAASDGIVMENLCLRFQQEIQLPLAMSDDAALRKFAIASIVDVDLGGPWRSDRRIEAVGGGPLEACRDSALQTDVLFAICLFPEQPENHMVLPGLRLEYGKLKCLQVLAKLILELQYL
eukprot:g30959.t1